MPVIIKELVIKASVAIGGKDKTAPAGDQRGTPLDRKAIIQECVEEVLKVLQRQGER